jgi:hypothetical protein
MQILLIAAVLTTAENIPRGAAGRNDMVSASFGAAS